VKKIVLYFFFLAAFTGLASAQGGKLTVADMRILKKKEDSLKLLAKDLFTKDNTGERMRSDSLFVRTLVRSLQVKNSFYFPYDSVQGISKLYAPDSTFRIFTWQISFDNDYSYNRQRGAIQYRTADGSLKLVPLKDYSEFADNPLDSVRTKDTWIGAVYYNIIQTKYNGKSYYTLFGYDGNSHRSNKKWIEVLTFDEKNMPLFGGKFFSFEKDSIKRAAQYRYSIEYKKEASTLVNYHPDEKMILVDHLISETDEPENKWSYIPDGDYEGFKWENGKWIHVDKVYNFKLKDGEFPMPDPLRDDNGNNNEGKLKTQNDKNTKPPVKKKGGGVM
jgi:hypothetical protein